MDVTEVKAEFEKVHKAVHDLRGPLEERLAKLEKGRGTAEIEQKIANTEKALEDAQAAMIKAATEAKAQQERMDRIETALRRPSFGGAKGDALTPEQVEHKAALSRYLRKGEDASLRALEQKALSVGSDADGGYYVSADTSGEMVRKIQETSPIRQLASVQTIGTDALEGPSRPNRMTAYWVGETQARTTTATPQIGKWRIPVHEMYVYPETTQQMLDDSMTDVEAWLSEESVLAFAIKEGADFTTGDGVGKPRGFCATAVATTADATRTWGTMQYLYTGTSAGFGNDPAGMNILIDLVESLKPAYRPGSVMVMNRGTRAAVRKLKTSTTGTPIWLPAQDTSAVLASPILNGNGSVLGVPVVDVPDMADIAANSLSIAFGNFRIGYKVVDRIGIRVLRDPFTNKPFVGFHTSRRVGGDVLNSEAIKLLKFGTS